MIPLRPSFLSASPAPFLSASPAPGAEEVIENATSALTVLVFVLVALVLALVVAEVIAALVRSAGRRRSPWFATALSRRGRRPLRAVLLVGFAWIAVRLAVDAPPDGPGWRPVVEHVLLIAFIVAVAWLIGSMAFVAEDAALRRYRTDVPDNRHARRVRTQVMVLRRLTVVILAFCAVAGILLTFEGARAAGAGLLASAGLLSVVAGLAAQTSLANLFAGLQLAFTDAIRVDDVVIVDGEFGRIEEITMTYVVVHVWDDRRLIMPSTYFTTTPFQNWTRRAAELLGTVEIDVDWQVPVPAMRAELTRLLEASPLWDRRVGVLQVTEATGGVVRVRALASAADAPTLFDLRCRVREGLVAWLQREHPEALPRTRWQEEQGRPRTAADDDAVPDDAVPDDAVPAGPAPSGTASPSGIASPAGGEEPSTADAGRPSESLPDARRVRRRSAAEFRAREPRPDDTVILATDEHAGLFTGSLEAVERSRSFSGPGRDVIEEREHHAGEREDHAGGNEHHDRDREGR